MRKINYWKFLFFLIFFGLFLKLAYPIYQGDQLNNGERSFFSLVKSKFLEKQEPINVIIAATPLQAKIAEKIIEHYPDEKFYFVMLAHNGKNNAYEHYFNQLKNKTDKALSFYFSNMTVDELSLFEIKIKSLLFPEVKRFFMANIEKREIHAMMSSYPNAEIKTFDDGTMNIIKNSQLLTNDNYAKTGKYYKYFPHHLTKSMIRENSTEHFTIFKDFKNAMDNGNRKITYIPLFNTKNIPNSTKIKDTIKILLGTVEEELKETSEKVIEEFSIKYTTKHPRQNYDLDNAITLKSDLIIEDYLLQEIDKNPHTQYEIYTFFSGAGLTIKDFPNVKVFAIKPTSFPDDYWLNPVYELFEQANIPILYFNDK